MSMVTFDVENGSIIYRTMIKRKDDQTKGKRNPKQQNTLSKRRPVTKWGPLGSYGN